MDFSLGRVRQIAAASIGAGSMIAGLVLAFRLVTPGLVEQLPTSELLGLLGLLVLPLLMLWVIHSHRRTAASIPAPEPVLTAQVDDASSVELIAELSEAPIEEDPQVEIHAPGRRTVRHRRHDHVRAQI